MEFPLMLAGEHVGVIRLTDTMIRNMQQEEIFALSGSLMIQGSEIHVVGVTLERVPAQEGIRRNVFTGVKTDETQVAGQGNEQPSVKRNVFESSEDYNHHDAKCCPSCEENNVTEDRHHLENHRIVIVHACPDCGWARSKEYHASEVE